MIVQNELPTFSRANKEYASASLQLTRRLFKFLSKVLKQPEGCLETMLQNPFVALHNLHYAPVKSEPENGIVGLGKKAQATVSSTLGSVFYEADSLSRMSICMNQHHKSGLTLLILFGCSFFQMTPNKASPKNTLSQVFVTESQVLIAILVC